MFAISFMTSLSSSCQSLVLKIPQTVGFIRKALTPKHHSKMGEKHLTKIVTPLWRVSTKIMQQSEQQALNKFTTRWATFFGNTTQN